MSKELSQNLGELNASVKKYVKAKIDLAKLSLLEKATRFTSYLFNMLAVMLFAFLIIGFAATSLAVWYGRTYDNYVTGLLIAGGGIILIAIIFYLLRKKIVENSVMKNFSEVLFDDEKNQS
ncbi:MAG: phage holin family protein [Bacteroidales bacterium]